MHQPAGDLQHSGGGEADGQIGKSVEQEQVAVGLCGVCERGKAEFADSHEGQTQAHDSHSANHRRTAPCDNNYGGVES